MGTQKQKKVEHASGNRAQPRLCHMVYSAFHLWTDVRLWLRRNEIWDLLHELWTNYFNKKYIGIAFYSVGPTDSQSFNLHKILSRILFGYQNRTLRWEHPRRSLPRRFGGTRVTKIYVSSLLTEPQRFISVWLCSCYISRSQAGRTEAGSIAAKLNSVPAQLHLPPQGLGAGGGWRAGLVRKQTRAHYSLL